MFNRPHSNRKQQGGRKARLPYRADYKRHQRQPAHDDHHQAAAVRPEPAFVLPFEAMLLADDFRFGNRHRVSASQRFFCLFMMTNLLVFSLSVHRTSAQTLSTQREAKREMDHQASTEEVPAVLHGYPVETLRASQLTDCQYQDSSFAYAQKTCLVNGQRHTMYAIRQPGFFAGRGPVLNTPIQEYNEHVLTNIGVLQPEKHVYYEKNGYYKSRFFVGEGEDDKHLAELFLSIKHDDQFVSYAQLLRGAEQYFSGLGIADAHARDTLAAKAVRTKIGEVGLAKLAVAHTFMHLGSGSWGITNQELMVLFSDYRPTTIESYSMGLGGIERGYYSHIRSMMTYFAERQLYFSLETVTQMEIFYRQIASMDAPPHVSPVLFQSICDACEKACHAVSQSRGKTERADQPNAAIHQALRVELEQRLLPIIDAATARSSLNCY